MLLLGHALRFPFLVQSFGYTARGPGHDEAKPVLFSQGRDHREL